MSRRLAHIGVILALGGCATAAPAPETSDTASQATALARTDSTATPMGMQGGGMGAMHRHRMGQDSADGGMGQMRQERMREGSGAGMQHRGEGMQAGGGMQMRMRMGQSEESEPREVPEDLQEGERIYREICSLCHTMDPPPNLAPPMSHVARHLRQEFTSEDEAVAHVVSFLPAPDAERSIMPEMARERFGLMPPQPLPANLLEAVGKYIWFLGSPE